MNWKNFVEESHAKAYRLPQGWDSRDTIAAQMDCSPDHVRQLLGPALKSGAVETAQFPVWDHLTKRIVRVTAYRKSPPKNAAKCEGRK